MAKEPQQTGSETTQGAGTEQRVHIDTAGLKSTYCNVCNATSTREEVVINFGVNKNWDLTPGHMDVQLEHRIILSPFAAKRLQQILNQLMEQYQTHYGDLK